MQASSSHPSAHHKDLTTTSSTSRSRLTLTFLFRSTRSHCGTENWLRSTTSSSQIQRAGQRSFPYSSSLPCWPLCRFCLERYIPPSLHRMRSLLIMDSGHTLVPTFLISRKLPRRHRSHIVYSLARSYQWKASSSFTTTTGLCSRFCPLLESLDW